MLWVGPLVLFDLLIHMSQPGHIMLLVAAGFCAMGLGLAVWLPGRWASRAAAAGAICTIVQFAAYPWSAEGSGVKRVVDDKIAYMSAIGLLRIDEWRRTHRSGDFWPTEVHQDTGDDQSRDRQDADGSRSDPRR